MVFSAFQYGGNNACIHTNVQVVGSLIEQQKIQNKKPAAGNPAAGFLFT
jgi:hypothetical protein